jgi:enoyl-CoA hydratase/carnithine racemase
MTYDEITYEAANLVATITLNRPDKLNAWTQKMEEEIVAAIRAASADEQVRVIILTGAGKGFCAPWDLVSSSRCTATSASLQRRLDFQ